MNRIFVRYAIVAGFEPATPCSGHGLERNPARGGPVRGAELERKAGPREGLTARGARGRQSPVSKKTGRYRISSRAITIF
jgi:hypothetical protein